MNRRWVGLIYTVLILSNEVVLSAYHWKISDDGKKIVSVINTPYQLRFPGSLTDFLRQNENVKNTEKHHAEMRRVADKISVRERIDNPQFEKQFRENEESCIKSKDTKLEPDSFYTSFSAELCPEFHKSYQQYTAFVKEYFGTPPDNDKRPPRCNYWFEAVKLKGANNFDFSKVTVPDKPTNEDGMYLRILEMYFPNFAKFSRGPEGMQKYGQMLSSMLSHSDERISKNSYLHMAAAAYWRAQGQLAHAFTCYKTGAKFLESTSWLNANSIELANDSFQLSLSTLLNQVEQSEGAYLILRDIASRDTISCITAMAYAAAGDASVLTGVEEASARMKAKPSLKLKLTQKERDGVFSRTFENYATSIHFFMEAKKENQFADGSLFDELFNLAESKAYVLSCHMRLYEALEKQKENLEQLVDEKHTFQEFIDKRNNASRKVTELRAYSEWIVHQRLFFELVKYGPHPYRKCEPRPVNRFPKSSSKDPNNYSIMIICQLTKPESEYILAMDEVKRETMTTRPAVDETSWKIAEVFTRNRVFEKGLNDIAKKSEGDANYFRMIEPKYSDRVYDESRDRPWRRADWPNSVDCQAVVSSSNPFKMETFPQVFISPENRGWIVSELLTKHLNLGSDDQLPLPWFEPRCDFVDMHELRVFTALEAVERLLNTRLDRRNENYSEKTLKTVLVRLAEREMSDHEMGARIHVLMKHNIGPLWVSMNLAGLYWRVQGNPHQAAKCLLGSFLEKPEESFISIVQMSQVILKTTKMVNDAHEFLNQQLNLLAYKEPMFHYLQGRIKILVHDVDKAIQHLKDALDKDPENEMIAEDLLKIACSGKSTKPAISSQFPTVCCSALVQDAVCIRPRKESPEQCYVVDSSGSRPQLVYHRCNGVYDGLSKKTSDFANIVSPFLLLFNTVSRRDDVSIWLDQIDGIQTVDSVELPLDYGGTDSFFAERPAEWWENAKNEMRYKLPVKEESMDEWSEEWESDLAALPPKPLSFLWIREKSLMMQWDARLPERLPAPSIHQIRRGIAVFPPPQTATSSCSGVATLDALFENAPSTWVSVTAKGEDIEKYVDLRGPVPSMASLQPVCPPRDKYENSPILGLDHIPAFSLSDQFLFYKPEKALAEALKSLGNERDTIEHVAARLHAAMVHNSAKNGDVNWLLCVLSSLYWRVTGDSENAMKCLRCALHTAPPHMRDVALVSLANICHQAGLLNSALIAAGAALSTSPKLVAIHFTIANIYASIGDYQRALNFYYSTLSLQSNFQPAKDRIRAVYCHSGHEFDF